MKKYVCEVCGCTSLKRIDDTTWECQECGLLYTNDEIQIVDITEAETVKAVGTSSQTSNYSAPRRIPSLTINGEEDIKNIITRAYMFIEDGDWDSADSYLEAVLDKSPENADAYLGKLLISQRAHSKEELAESCSTFENNPNYKRLIRFGSDEIKAYLRDCNKEIIYRHALKKAENASSEADYHASADAFEPVLDYKDSKELQKRCMDLALQAKSAAEEAVIYEIYCQAVNRMEEASNEAEYKEAAEAFEPILDYKDSKELQEKCLESIEAIKKDKTYEKALKLKTGIRIPGIEEAISLFETIKDWKDSEQQIEDCRNKIEEIAEQEKQKREKEERREIERKKKKKRTIIGVIIAFVLFVAAIIFAFLYIFVLHPLSVYNKAVGFYNASNYKSAIDSFKGITDYKDSQKLLNDCYLKLAEDAYSAQKYGDAIGYYSQISNYDTKTEFYRNACYNYAKVQFEEKEYYNAAYYFEKCNDWSDSNELMKEAEYQYIKLHCNNKNNNTKNYLIYLTKVGYKDCANIYKDLYSWKADIVVNSSKSDETTDYSSIKNVFYWYFHIRLSGGEPNATTQISYTVKYPNGQEQSNNFDGEWKSGSSGSVYGLYKSTGTLSIIVYDDKGNVIGEKSVEIFD